MKWIKGKVKFVDLGPGFYGIVTEDGEELLPLNLPEQLKFAGKEVEITATNADGEASIFMWGKAIRITGFKTI